MCCSCMVGQPFYKEREVALVLSSEEKMYVLLVGITFDGSESTLDLLGSHRVEDIRAVLVGLSLQVVRVNVDRSVTYLFITRSFKKSIQLLYTLKLSDLSAPINKCSLRRLRFGNLNGSLEQVWRFKIEHFPILDGAFSERQ